MKIHQFYNEPLAQASYALIEGNEMVVIDPAREVQPYIDMAEENGASIRAIVETHPHADFISGHIELSERCGAPVYISHKAEAKYSHKNLHDGDILNVGQVKIHVMETPGHSPDSITLLATDHKTGEKAAFTGDTLLVGDVGRPDLRDDGSQDTGQVELARMMYNTINNKLQELDRNVKVYPAHGPGSLCGKNTEGGKSSIMQEEMRSNWALQEMSETEFINELLDGQPFIPKYFSYDVKFNLEGMPRLKDALESVPVRKYEGSDTNALVIDIRPAKDFKSGHIPGAINIICEEDKQFETWLGAIVGPGESFYLAADDENKAKQGLRRAAEIGYEKFVPGLVIKDEEWTGQMNKLDIEAFENNRDQYNILDIRNNSEREEVRIFKNSLHIPLHELRERAVELPSDKPIVVHCSGGYRSAAGSSIVKNHLPDVTVYDMGERINKFKKD